MLGVVKVAPLAEVPTREPPVAKVYQEIVVPLEEVALMLTVPASNLEPGIVPVIAGEGRTVKVVALVAVPPGVVTETIPVVPAPITATMVVPLFEVIDVMKAFL